MKQVDFGNGRIMSCLAGTAVPMLVAQLLSLLYSIVDRIYIGRIPGEGTQALGGIGICFPVIIIITAFTNMFGLGGSPLFAIARGRGDQRKAGEVLNTVFRCLLLVGLCLTLLGELLAPFLLRAFGATEEVLYFSLPYLRIYLLGTVFSMLAGGLNPFINGEGFPRMGMLTVILGAVSNLLLDPLFIFVLHLGVAGAALATILSQAASGLFVLFFLTGRTTEYRLSSPFLPMEGRYLPHVGSILSLGTAPFVMQFTNSLVQISCNHVLMEFEGNLYVTIMTIVSSVRQILDVPTASITDGATPIISFNYGAGQMKRVGETVKLMSVIAIAYTLLVQLLIELFPRSFISIFTQDGQVKSLAVEALHIYFFAFGFQALQYCGQTVFKALNKKRQAIFFSLFRKVVMVVPLTFLLPYAFGMGARGVFMAEPISNLVGGLCCYVTMLFTLRRESREKVSRLKKPL